MLSHADIAIIGAGPIGLAAAAHARERGLKPVVVEQGPEIGHAVRQWGHVTMFSPWRFNVDAAAERLLAAAGWNRPDPERHPTGAELVGQYLEPLANRTALRHFIALATTVTAVGREGVDKLKTEGRSAAPFVLRVRNGSGEGAFRAAAVIDASGTFFAPNPGGAGGLPAIGEEAAHDGIQYGMPDICGSERSRYAGHTVAVLGGGHSAIGNLIELARLASEAPGTRVVWLFRGANPAKAFGGGDADALAARGALGTTLARLIAEGRVEVRAGFRLTLVEPSASGLVLVGGVDGASPRITVDRLIVATGFRPDLGLLREVRVALDPALECPPALAPLIDPNVHSCGTVRPHGAAELSHPEPGFYIAGMKSYGRAPTFLLATGHEQVRSIVAEIAGDHQAARRVELELPETGVCSGPGAADEAAGCCGGAPVDAAAACCKRDEEAKRVGEAGCGCSSGTAAIAATGSAVSAACCG
jgi:thioredoxin reductase